MSAQEFVVQIRTDGQAWARRDSYSVWHRVFDRVWVHVYGTADAEEAHYVTLYHTKQANMRGACYQDVPIARADITHDLPDGKLCKVCLIAIHRETGVWLDGRENHEQATATA